MGPKIQKWSEFPKMARKSAEIRAKKDSLIITLNHTQPTATVFNMVRRFKLGIQDWHKNLLKKKII